MTPLPLKPTAEQRRILDAGGRVVKINARAGTGKTATLLMLAEKNPGLKILYLVFNSRNRQEAKGKFPPHVHVHTLHSFALSSMRGRFEGFETIRPSDFLRHYGAKKETLAALTRMFLVYFLNSPHPKLEDGAGPFHDGLSGELQKLFKTHEAAIVAVSRKTLARWYKDRRDCPHDFYLKLSHHERAFQARLNRYDLVLVEEGQDLSPIMLDALSSFRGRVVLVGDSHQQIYGFRHARDAMRHVAHDRMLDLTRSFRFGPAIARLATRFIRCGKDEPGFLIRGNRGKTSRVYCYERLEALRLGRDTAILCRTNFSLFKNALALRARRVPFRFERDISAELYRTLDVYWLSVRETDRIRDDLIRSFADIGDLKEYAETLEDYQLLKTAEIVKTYERDFPEIVYELLALCGERDGGRSDALVLSTIHAAKGQEYGAVVLDDDVTANLGAANKKDIPAEEMNAVYVAMTRAKADLYLPAGMTILFDDEWQDYAETIPHAPAGRVERKVRTPDSARRKPVEKQGAAASRAPGKKGGTSRRRRSGRAPSRPGVR